MTTFKQQLSEQTLIYTDSDNTTELSIWFSSKLNLYCLNFNGKYFSYKTWNGLVNKRNYFIEKYKLQPIEPTTITFIN